MRVGFERLAVLPDGHPEKESCRSAVADAIEIAEDFARGLPCAACESVIRQITSSENAARGDFVREQAIAAVVRAANTAALGMHSLDLRREPREWGIMGPVPGPGPLSHLADVTADLVALEAFTAAMDASDAVGYADNFINGAIADFETLRSLNLGSYPQAGDPIDPSPKGPLGPLCPEPPQPRTEF